MCYKERIIYRCGHNSALVVRPCPLTTRGHNYPVCQIDLQYTLEWNADTMCTACEREMHSRWTLVQEWEHRWFHERGVCPCPVIFRGLSTRPRAMGSNLEHGKHSDDEATLGGSPQMALAIEDQLEEKGNADVKPENSDESKQFITRNHHDGNQIVKIGGRKGQGPKDRIPALYEEKAIVSDGRTTTMQVAVRQPSQYAAEWLEDHRELHSSGKCPCPLETRPIIKHLAPMSADAEKVLRMHRQITGEGCDPETWVPPSEEEIERMRKETKIPELGTIPRWTMTRVHPPDQTQYPLRLGSNMYLKDETTMVWDAELEARLANLQLPRDVGRECASSNIPTMGRSTERKLWEPNDDQPSRVRRNGARRNSVRATTRRATVQQTAGVGFGIPTAPMVTPQHSLIPEHQVLHQQQAGLQQSTTSNLLEWPYQHTYYGTTSGYALPEAQQHTVPYGIVSNITVSQYPQPVQYAPYETICPNPITQPQQTICPGMSSSIPVSQNEQDVQNMTSGMNLHCSVTRPEEQVTQKHITPAASAPRTPGPASPAAATPEVADMHSHRETLLRGETVWIDGAEPVLGYYLPQPSTDTGNGPTGHTVAASLEPTSTKSRHRKGHKQIAPTAVHTAAASVEPTPTKNRRRKANKQIAPTGDSLDKSTAASNETAQQTGNQTGDQASARAGNQPDLVTKMMSSAANSSPATPTTSKKKKSSKIGQSIRRRKKREQAEREAAEREKAEKEAAEEREEVDKSRAERDKVDEIRSDDTHYCGLPIGGGPEGRMTHMPDFASCARFTPLPRVESQNQLLLPGSQPQFPRPESHHQFSLPESDNYLSRSEHQRRSSI